MSSVCELNQMDENHQSDTSRTEHCAEAESR